MAKITFTRIITDENLLLEIAKLSGYKESDTENITEEMLVSEANEQNLKIEKVLEDTTKCIAITGTEEVANTETPAEYMAKLYQSLIDDKINADTLVIQRKQLEEARKVEDEAIEKQVKELVGETEIIVE